jgi:TrpR family trp operon transcriptional repressor
MNKKTAWRNELEKVWRAAAKNPKIFSLFLDDLLSPEELAALPVRWQIVKRLHQSVPQHKIANELGIGVGTVTRGSKMLKNKQGGFWKILKLTKNMNLASNNQNFWRTWRL